MARALSIQLHWGHDVSHLADEVELMLNPLRRTELSEIILIPDLNLSKPILMFMQDWTLRPLKEIGDIVASIDSNEYAEIIRIIQNLASSSDLTNVIRVITNLEEAFNFSRLIASEELEKMKIEDMQADLISLKRAAGELKVNPSNSLRAKLDKLFDDIISKSASIQETHEFLKSVGIDEKALIQSYERIEGKDGSTHYIWKKP